MICPLCAAEESEFRWFVDSTGEEFAKCAKCNGLTDLAEINAANEDLPTLMPSQSQSPVAYPAGVAASTGPHAPGCASWLRISRRARRRLAARLDRGHIRVRRSNRNRNVVVSGGRGMTGSAEETNVHSY
jgi:hypothetical protein